MTVTRNHIFGAMAAVEPATPGSCGRRPSGFRLPTTTSLGCVRLQVADLARSLAFHEGTLGLRSLERDGARAVLGMHGDPREVGLPGAPERGGRNAHA